MRPGLLLMIGWLLLAPAWAHQVILTDNSDRPLLAILLPPEWTVLSSQDGLELTSANSRTRLHCLELLSCANEDEAKVFLRTLRDSIYQSYQEVSTDALQMGGRPALRLRATGISRGFETSQDAIIMRTSYGTFCLVLLQQDVGYEAKLPPLTEIVTVPPAQP